MVGSAVDTIVWSSDAMKRTRSSALKISRRLDAVSSLIDLTPARARRRALLRPSETIGVVTGDREAPVRPDRGLDVRGDGPGSRGLWLLLVRCGVHRDLLFMDCDERWRRPLPRRCRGDVRPLPGLRPAG